MFGVHIWVPTKGWRFIRSFKEQSVAMDFATLFEPLEVKVVDERTHETWYGGRLCMPNYDLPEYRTLTTPP